MSGSLLNNPFGITILYATSYLFVYTRRREIRRGSRSSGVRGASVEDNEEESYADDVYSVASPQKVSGDDDESDDTGELLTGNDRLVTMEIIQRLVGGK